MSERYSFGYRKERARIENEIYRPVASVYLKGSDGNWYLFYPYVDSGADISLFTRTDCDLLGYDLKTGEERLIGGVMGGLMKVYIHKMAIRIGDAEFDAKISFADREEVPRLLGRMGIFQKFQVCFDEKTLMVHFIKN